MNYFSVCAGIEGFGEGIQQAYEGFAKTERQQQRIYQGYGYNADNQQVQFGTQFPTCIGFSEIDKYAVAIIKYHYPDRTSFGDTTKIDTRILPDFSLLCAGFPCQSFSIAGKRQGFTDIRGTIFFEVARILRDKRPAHFLLENVRGLASHDTGKTLQRILEVLSELGYYVETTVLNSKDYGVPQNRERVFFIGHLADKCGNEILSVGNGYEEIVAAKYGQCLSGTISTANQAPKSNFDGSTTLVQVVGAKSQGARVYSTEGLSSTLSSVGGGQGAKTGLYMTQVARTNRSGGRKSPHGSKQNWDSYEIDNQIRRLTPVECERLQGFKDNFTAFGRFENGSIQPISDSQRYKVLGNAVTTFVPEAIVLEMLIKGCLPL